jgi:dihydroorotate dehydrogenase (NAD+) catalytic subunit
VTETVSIAPAQVSRPYLIKIKDSLISVELWGELPLDQWLKYEYPKAKRTKLPLIASIGYNAEEVRKLAPRVAAAGADALELTTHYLSDPASTIEATKAAKEVVNIPVFVKLNPNAVDIVQLARSVEKAGANGIVAINPLGPCLAIDIENAMPMLGSPKGYGWLSGPSIKPFAIRCVADIACAVKIPIIGSGGVSTGRDAIEFIMAGASAVQLSTAAIIRGHKIYGLIADEMGKFMHAKGYTTVNDFKGVALHHIPEETFRAKAKPVEVIASKCTACGLCERQCLYDAIHVVGRLAKVDPVKCSECGLCVSVCPTRGIRF